MSIRKTYRLTSAANNSVNEQTHSNVSVVIKAISNIESDKTQSIIENADYSIIVSEEDARTPLHVLEHINHNGLEKVLGHNYTLFLVVESRWVDSYTNLMNHYGKTCHIHATDDSEKVSRNKIVREDYIENKIYRLSDIVFEQNTGLYAEIIDRGSNYVRVVNQLGEVNRCWLDAISPANNISEVFLSNKTDMYKGNYIPVTDKDLIKHLQESFAESSDVYKTIQEIRSMNFLDTPYNTFIDQQRLARVFATVMGLDPKIIGQDPKTIVNLALLKLPGLVLSPRGWDMVSTFIEQLDSLKIPYNRSYLNAIKQHLRPNLVKSQNEACEITNMLHSMSIDSVLDRLENNPELLDNEINMLTVDDIEQIMDSDDTDYYDLENEDPDDEKDADELYDKHYSMYESISFNERIARSIRFKRLQPILQQKRQAAMNRAGSLRVTVGRARKMAISMMKNKLLQGRTNIPASEKARIENLIRMRKNVVNRVAIKLVPKIKTLERQRFLR